MCRCCTYCLLCIRARTYCCRTCVRTSFSLLYDTIPVPRTYYMTPDKVNTPPFVASRPIPGMSQPIAGKPLYNAPRSSEACAAWRQPHQKGGLFFCTALYMLMCVLRAPTIIGAARAYRYLLSTALCTAAVPVPLVVRTCRTYCCSTCVRTSHSLLYDTIRVPGTYYLIPD